MVDLGIPHRADVTAEAFAAYCERRETESQLGQEHFVTWLLGDRCDGFFVEFGATDGLELSNTLVLERDFGWTGILAEPNRHYHSDLSLNRRCYIDQRAVFTETGRTVSFRETELKMLSTIEQYADKDYHAERRADGVWYDVTTVSLRDLLDTYDAPPEPDYLSIDTEGSEFDILSSYDWSRRFSVITVEHQYGDNRWPILDLLQRQGYVRLLDDVSRWDDWFVLPERIPGWV